MRSIVCPGIDPRKFMGKIRKRRNASIKFGCRHSCFHRFPRHAFSFSSTSTMLCNKIENFVTKNISPGSLCSTGPPNDQRSTVSQQPPPENKQTGSQSTSGIDETSTPPKEKEDKLPLLSRPLGVKEPPSTKASTWAQNMLNQEVRMEQRDKL